MSLALDDLVPNARQPRTVFDEAALQELAASVRHLGLLQPILVRPRQDGRYEIVAGERRYRAARLAQLPRIPAIVRRSDDEGMLTEALVENLHRADLNALEEAAAYEQLLNEFGLTHEELAVRVGKSRSAISNTLRLLALPPKVQGLLAGGSLSAGHARALLGLASPEQQQELAEHIVEDGLTVRATEAWVRRAQASHARAPDDDSAQRDGRRPMFVDLEERLRDALATGVRITGDQRRGRVVIDYHGREDLDRLLAVLGKGSGVQLHNLES